MNKSEKVLTFEEFESRCKVPANLLLEELRRFKSKQEWDFVFDHGNPSISFDDEEPLVRIILPIGKDGWRMPIWNLRKPSQ